MCESRGVSRLNMKMTSITKWMLLLCATVLIFTKSASTSEARVVCYYTNWSVYRPGTARFNPQNINPYLCTHLIYAFGGFTKDNTLKPFDKYQDIEKGGYAKFTGLKTYNKDLKTMLAIGGWNEGSSRFSPMVASKQRRKEFVKNSIKFLRQNRFDGLDLDWEYPAFRDGGKPKDRDNYARLVRELRDEFEREANKTGRARLLLTMAVPAGIEYIQKGYDVPKLNQYLDWFNILSYDYHSAFEPSVNHHSPLYPLEEASEYSVDGELNIDYTIKFYLENGAEPDKLVLGIPTYGRSYTLFNADARELGAPADGPGEQGDATREKGYLAYYEICEYIKSPQKPVKKTKRTDVEDEDEEEEEEENPEAEPWTVVQPAPHAMGPYAVRGNQWVGYDDIDIVKKKAEYVADKGLGGIMFWSIDNDDFRGTCHNKPYPLIEAAKEALITKLGMTDNVISSDKQTSTSVISRNRSKSRGNSPAKISSSTERAVSASRENKKAVTATTPAWIVRTPEPPTTPDPGSDFKCEEEGFFDHPRDCKKYFWCLDSGPSNLGIVAHQFTCPSGLFFNKAADSCDFARNVFCNKDRATTSTTTTTASPVTADPHVTTARTTTTRPTTKSATTRKSIAKLSSKSTLFLRSTTSTSTQATLKDEEEYEDDDGYDLAKGLLDTEEDPKVIKELISLIRKAGGVDQLEKQLKLGEDQSARTIAPTASIPKKLYERVLSNTRSTTFNTKIDENAPGYNSRLSAQNAGLEKTSELKTIRKDRPKYTTINRNRTPTSTSEAPESDVKDDEGDDEEDEEETSAFMSKVAESYTQKPFMPQYVNIRRTKATTTETPQDLGNNPVTRNALFERNESVLETTLNGAVQSNVETGNKRESLIPDYVSIRREKPNSDPEETSNGATSKYQTIVRTRGTTTEKSAVNEQEHSSASTLNVEKTNEVGYVTVQRTRGTTPTSTATTSAEPQHDNDMSVSDGVTESASTTPDKVVTVSLGTSTTTVLNTQITTLLNTAARSEVKETVYLTNSTTAAAFSISANYTTEAVSATTPTTTTTTTTTSTTEALLSTAVRKTILKKRTRPTTTFSPTEATTTTTAKASTTGRRRNFINRRTGPDSTTAGSTSSDNDVTTETSRTSDRSQTPAKNSFRRRGSSKFEPKEKRPQNSNTDESQPIESPDDASHRFGGNSRRPSFKPSNTREKQNNTEASSTSTTSPNGRPTRTFVRRRFTKQSEGGDAGTTTHISSSTTPASRTTDVTKRKPLRVGVRRRNPISSTAVPESTIDSGSGNDLAGQETVEKAKSDEQSLTSLTTAIQRSTTPATSASTKKELIRKTVKIQRRPLTSVKTQQSQATTEETPTPSVSVEKKRDSKKYSASFKQNQLDEMLKNQASTEKIVPYASTESIEELNADTAIAIAAHQLLGAPLPSTAGYEEAASRDADAVFRSSPGRAIVSRASPTTTYFPRTSPSPATVSRASPIAATLEDLEQELHLTRDYLMESPVTGAFDPDFQYLTPLTTTASTTQKSRKRVTQPFRRISTTIPPPTQSQPVLVLTSPSTILARRRPDTVKAFDKIKPQGTPQARTYRPIIDYEYYDDNDDKILDKFLGSSQNVLLDSRGIIGCLDIGNFPHPSSCKKFISCARDGRSGAIYGWEYSCPSELSYDPVGGICNWSAGLGCNES